MAGQRRRTAGRRCACRCSRPGRCTAAGRATRRPLSSPASRSPRARPRLRSAPAPTRRRRPRPRYPELQDPGVWLAVVVPDEVAQPVVHVGAARPAGPAQHVAWLPTTTSARPRRAGGSTCAAAAWGTTGTPGPSAGRRRPRRRRRPSADRVEERRRASLRGRPLPPALSAPAAHTSLLPSRKTVSAARKATSSPRRRRGRARIARPASRPMPITVHRAVTCRCQGVRESDLRRSRRRGCWPCSPRRLPASSARRGPRGDGGSGSGPRRPRAPWRRRPRSVIEDSRLTIARSTSSWMPPSGERRSQRREVADRGPEAGRPEDHVDVLEACRRPTARRPARSRRTSGAAGTHRAARPRAPAGAAPAR